MKHRIVVEGGTVRFIYHDELIGFRDRLGESHTARASHVEPVGSCFQADMAPVAGPTLEPLPSRTAALQTEVAWLLANNIPIPLSLAETLRDHRHPLADQCGHDPG